MPTYEMPTLIRVINKPEIAAALKRVAQAIFKTGGFIRKIENLGQKELPCKTSAHGYVNREANHFLFYFDVPPSSLINLMDEYKRDVDIIRTKIYKQIDPSEQPVKKCTLQEELLPPVYRPDVQKMIAAAEKKSRKKKKFYTGDGVYPFQK